MVQSELTRITVPDSSYAFNIVKRTAVLAEGATCKLVLTPFITDSYGERPAIVFFGMDSGERRKVDFSSGVWLEMSGFLPFSW